MSDWLPDSPMMARGYCPGCEPAADPLSEILETRYCDSHAPRRDGSEDDQVVAQNYLSGSADAGGDDNRAACDLIHRPTRREQ